MQPKKNTKKTNSRPNRAVWTVFVNCAHWRGSTLAKSKTVLIMFPLNLQTITITLDVVKWRWGGDQAIVYMYVRLYWQFIAIVFFSVAYCSVTIFVALYYHMGWIKIITWRDAVVFHNVISGGFRECSWPWPYTNRKPTTKPLIFYFSLLIVFFTKELSRNCIL